MEIIAQTNGWDTLAKNKPAGKLILSQLFFPRFPTYIC